MLPTNFKYAVIFSVSNLKTYLRILHKKRFYYSCGLVYNCDLKKNVLTLVWRDRKTCCLPAQRLTGVIFCRSECWITILEPIGCEIWSLFILLRKKCVYALLRKGRANQRMTIPLSTAERAITNRSTKIRSYNFWAARQTNYSGETQRIISYIFPIISNNVYIFLIFWKNVQVHLYCLILSIKILLILLLLFQVVKWLCFYFFEVNEKTYSVVDV